MASLLSESEEDSHEREEEEEEEIEEYLELVDIGPKISVPMQGGIETILNLREWLKSPYQLMTDA